MGGVFGSPFRGGPSGAPANCELDEEKGELPELPNLQNHGHRSPSPWSDRVSRLTTLRSRSTSSSTTTTADTGSTSRCDTNSSSGRFTRRRLSFAERWRHGHHFVVCWVVAGPVLCDLCLGQVMWSWYMRCECKYPSVYPHTSR